MSLQQKRPPPRKVYIASRLENVANVQALRDALRANDIEITYDWTTHGPVWRDGAARIREVAQLELAGVKTADAVILLLPGGRGTHTELGAALAANRPVFLLSPDIHAEDGPMSGPNTCAFYHHPLVHPVAFPIPFTAPALEHLARLLRDACPAGGTPRGAL